MKKINWQIVLGVFLVLLSALLYLLHFVIFRDAHHIFIYMIGDIAFVPIEVLLVTLIIHKVLSIRERRAKLHKLNMVIGAFFSEVGTEFLDIISPFDNNFEKIRTNLIIKLDWNIRNFVDIKKSINNYQYDIDSQKSDLTYLRNFLISKREFLLRLLENPNLLEHESFTELLWAVFHLTEELANRTHVTRLPPADYEHISIDIKRAYVLLISEWLDYMAHLNNKYPYLYSLAVRTNPFDPEAIPEIQS